MYELSKNHKCHTRDLRSLDYSQNFLITGGSDKKINLFTYKNGELLPEASSDAIEKNVLCVKINPFESSQGLFAIAGFVDGQIVGYDIHCTPIWMIEHNSNVNSLSFINADHFVSGSWDGHAIVWNIITKKKVSEFTEHKYAVSVFYNPITDLVISGSQDKALNLWSWKDGKKVKRHENAHTNIIREISPVDEVGFITCSNDETLKLWSSDLEEIQSFTGHTAFVFAVKSIGFGLYISGGEDRYIKIWKDQNCEQTIQLPASVWTLAFDSETGDIFAGCSDGYLRIFTRDMARRAPQQELDVFNKQVLQAASKKSGMGEEDIKKLPLTSQMKNYVGKKEGEIRVFRDGLNPEAYMWQGGQWVKIGDVITENPNQGSGGASSGGKKYYHGDAYFEAGEYDYIFDVDDESGVPKTIPYNDGGNPLQASEKYCMREGLSKGYIQQIRKFLMANSSRIPRSALKQETTKVDLKELRSTPCTTPLEFNNISQPEALMKKIREFNENAEGEKLNDKELNHIERMTNQLKDSSLYYNVKFDSFEIDSLKKLLKWRKDLKLPVWDLLRAFLKHYQSEALFSGLSAGHDVISQLCIGLESQNKQAIYTLILRTLSNILIHNTNKNGMLKYYELVLGAIRSITKSSPGLSSTNFSYAICAFLYNYSIAIIEKNLEKEQDTIKLYAETVRMRLEIEKEQENATLLLQGVSNILFKHHEKFVKDFAWVSKFLEKSNNKDLVLDIKMFVG